MFGLSLGRLGIAGRSGASLASLLWPTGADAGLWIDPSTAAASFQDSTGTTPLSAIGTVLDSSNPVGLALDRKGNLALGPELAIGSPSLTGGALFSSGTLTVPGTPGDSGTYTLPTQTGTKTYKVVYEALEIQSAGTSIQVRAGVNGNEGGFFLGFVGTTGVRSFMFTAPGTATPLVGFRRGDAATGQTRVSNISVREIPGNHLLQATSAARPLASARKNELVGTATLATQNVTTTAIPYTITFAGGGTVTASGTYVGALTNGQTFTPTAGTLTLTVAGSVTTAQLEKGSTATTYQAVVSASSYDAAAGSTRQKYDGTDDGLASATFPAGTLTSSMDCLIAVRRDSAASAVCGLYQSVAEANKVFGIAESASGSACVGTGAGTPTVWVDGTQLTGGTAVTRGTLHTALTAGDFHILEFRGLDLSTWTAAGFGRYTSYVLNGALGGDGVMLFPATTDAIRNRARTELAASVGLVL